MCASTCNLPQAAPHLTFEEISYGNQKGNQKEIQQFAVSNFAQQCTQEHERVVIQEIQCQKIQLEEKVLKSQILALSRQECRA
jgi:hypothetical protein